jgi:hypothetical protein
MLKCDNRALTAIHRWDIFINMKKDSLVFAWWPPIIVILAGLGLLVAWADEGAICFVAYILLTVGVLWLLIWATNSDHESNPRLHANLATVVSSQTFEASKIQAELAARIREAAAFKAELEAKRAEIAALKSGLNRTDAAELNEAIAQLYIDFEFERGRAEGDFAHVLAGLSELVDGLFAAAALVKGSPTPGERFVDQPAGSCKAFKTELTSDVALKGTIMTVRSPWVGFMANGKLKIITASNVSVYA